MNMSLKLLIKESEMRLHSKFVLILLSVIFSAHTVVASELCSLAQVTTDCLGEIESLSGQEGFLSGESETMDIGPYRTHALHFIPETSFTLFGTQKDRPLVQL